MIICVVVAASSLISLNAFAKPALHFSANQGKPVDIEDYSSEVPPSPAFAIDLSFGHADAERLWSLMRANQGSQVTVTIGDQTVMTPVVRDVPQGTGLELTLSDAKAFAAAREALGIPLSVPVK